MRAVWGRNFGRYCRYYSTRNQEEDEQEVRTMIQSGKTSSPKIYYIYNLFR